jgi:translation initiation factor IF-2
MNAIGWVADVKHKIDTKHQVPREPTRLGLPVATTRVRQALSRGRTNLVQVETRRRRLGRPGPDSSARQRPLSGSRADHPVAADASDRPITTRPAPVWHGKLTPAEHQARQRAVELAREEQGRRAQQEAEAALKAASDAREGAENPRRRQAVQSPQDAATDARKRMAPSSPRKSDATGAEPDKSLKRHGKGETRDRSGKLTIGQALRHAEGDERVRSLAALQRQRGREKRLADQAPLPKTKVIREVRLPEAITVRELANRMAESTATWSRRSSSWA